MSQITGLGTGGGGGGSGIQTITVDHGADIISPVANNINLNTANATVNFTGATPNILLDFGGLNNLVLGSPLSSITSGLENTGLGELALFSVTSGTGNTAMGAGTQQFLTTGGSNTAIGFNSMAVNPVTGDGNTGVGESALSDISTGSNNVAVGDKALQLVSSGDGNVGVGSDVLSASFTTGNNNIAIGQQTLLNLHTGSQNVAIGSQNGTNYTGAETNNILVGNGVVGVLGESNTTRIGHNSTSCYVAGIVGVTVSNPQTVVINSATGQLGIASGGGSPIETLEGDTGGPLGPTAGNFNIITNVASTNSGSSILFSGAGSTLTLNVTDALHNTIIGKQAGLASPGGGGNTALGFASAFVMTGGDFNTFVGADTAISLVNSSNNTAVGYAALNDATSGPNTVFGAQAARNLVGGTDNVLIGYNAGNFYDGSESNNIIVGEHVGVPAESNAIRVGTAGGIQMIAGNSNVFMHNFDAAGTPASIFVGGLAGNYGNCISANNVGVGVGAMANVTSGDATAIGFNAAHSLTTGAHNVAIGNSAFGNCPSGSWNLITGLNAGSNYTGSESNNLIFGYCLGTTGENAIMRLGHDGTQGGTTATTQTYVRGIYGNSPASPQMVIVNSSGQLGSQAIGGGGITTINGDVGSVTGSTVSFSGLGTAGATVSFNGSGTTMSLVVTDANGNTFMGTSSGAGHGNIANTGIGYQVLSSGVTGQSNVGLGYQALKANTGGGGNVGVGAQALLTNAGGVGNTALSGALVFLASGDFNIGVGPGAGNAYTSNESGNIILGLTQGTIGESNIMRLGTDGSEGTPVTASTYIAGINGNAVTGPLVNISSGNLTGVTKLTSDSTGRVTNNAQPAFQAYLSTTVNNVTGGGTNYTIIFDVESFDQGSNYNTGTGTFTAPVTGIYQFNLCVLVSGIAVGMSTAQLIIDVNASATQYNLAYLNPVLTAASGGFYGTNGSALIPLSAGDAVTFRIAISGGANVANVYGVGATDQFTYVSGYLVC